MESFDYPIFKIDVQKSLLRDRLVGMFHDEWLEYVYTPDGKTYGLGALTLPLCDPDTAHGSALGGLIISVSGMHGAEAVDLMWLSLSGPFVKANSSDFGPQF